MLYFAALSDNNTALNASVRQRDRYGDHAAGFFAGLGPGERFRHPKSYVFHVYSTFKVLENFDYMHNNPVKAGLVERAVDWRWSSARWYVLQRTVGVPITWTE